MGLNSHFVSRFLTIPWEHGDRRLWYYDFDTNKLESRSSRFLFAKEGLNTAEIESRLNRFVESPIAHARASLTAPASDAPGSLEWPLFRALCLLLLLQPFRPAESSKDTQTLEETLGRPDTEIDMLARAIGERYRLMRITVSPHSPLYYPSSGFFPLVAEPLGGTCGFGFAIPISERHAFIGVRSSVEPERTKLWTDNGAGFISNYSVGNTCRRVVVHPSVVAALDEREIAETIQATRASIQRGIEICGELAGIVKRMDAIFPG